MLHTTTASMGRSETIKPGLSLGSAKEMCMKYAQQDLKAETL